MASMSICAGFYKTGGCATAGCPYMHVKANKQPHKQKATAPASKQQATAPTSKQQATAPTSKQQAPAPTSKQQTTAPASSSKQQHKQKATVSETTLSQKKSIPCTFYKGGEGHCKNGDSCTFLHAKSVAKPVAKDYAAEQLEELVEAFALQLNKLDKALSSVHQ